MMLQLSAAERRTLRARAHALNPVVMIGNAGLTTTVLNEIHRNLASHEVIKIRTLSQENEERERLLTEICTALHAAPVQHIGKILVVYRPAPEKEKTPTARKLAPRRAPARRTKRSFQG